LINKPEDIPTELLRSLQYAIASHLNDNPNIAQLAIQNHYQNYLENVSDSNITGIELFRIA
jgi:hypothetical protein